ncbi:hypothetical protein N7474_006248 [Penicillium riverlandense]|uniref:uncharacterized protein n=1 Tax=Penicillium riverlandense TaxID=1903569 RepID=UPI002546F9F8|nr:uncharacterized protein N7474_006248 [Penicillium riverlandense]KAJ5820657.1 hypothetical protein N7474_006248 [Penicillium riverlandense]
MCDRAPSAALRVGSPRLAPASPLRGLLASLRLRPAPKPPPANWRSPPPRRTTPARHPWQAPPGVDRGAPPAARPGLEGATPRDLLPGPHCHTAVPRERPHPQHHSLRWPDPASPDRLARFASSTYPPAPTG